MPFISNISTMLVYLGGIAGVSSLALQLSKNFGAGRRLEPGACIGNDPSGKWNFLLSGINRSKCPIRIGGFCVTNKSRLHASFFDSDLARNGFWNELESPVYLQEGSEVSWALDQNSPKFPKNAKNAFIFDISGKKWWLGARRFRQVLIALRGLEIATPPGGRRQGAAGRPGGPPEK